jgi:hypothetical protein
LPELVQDRLRWVLPYHLSRTNNLPLLAAEEVGEMLDKLGSSAEVCLTEQLQPTPWLDLTRRRGQNQARVVETRG